MMASVCLRAMPLLITVRATFTNNYQNLSDLKVHIVVLRKASLFIFHISNLVLTVVEVWFPVNGQGCVN